MLFQKELNCLFSYTGTTRTWKARLRICKGDSGWRWWLFMIDLLWVLFRNSLCNYFACKLRKVSRKMFHNIINFIQLPLLSSLCANFTEICLHAGHFSLSFIYFFWWYSYQQTAVNCFFSLKYLKMEVLPGFILQIFADHTLACTRNLNHNE